MCSGTWRVCPDLTDRDRQVSEQEGKELAQSLKCAWVETSARHNANVGAYVRGARAS